MYIIIVWYASFVGVDLIEARPNPVHQRQTSLDSALSASLTDSGFPTQANENKSGFRPLSMYCWQISVFYEML